MGKVLVETDRGGFETYLFNWPCSFRFESWQYSSCWLVQYKDWWIWIFIGRLPQHQLGVSKMKFIE